MDKQDNMPLRIFKINKSKKPDDKKTVYLSDQMEKQETEKEMENGNTEGEKNGKPVKIFLNINSSCLVSLYLSLNIENN
jgi:hypothetical protein